MSGSLDALPVELQLNIFRSFLPQDDLDEIDRTDLVNLRLVCKSVHASASVIFFERSYMLLRMKDNVYVEPGSFRQLRKNSETAARVKHLWVASAAADPDWLKERAAFDRTKYQTGSGLLS